MSKISWSRQPPSFDLPLDFFDEQLLPLVSASLHEKVLNR